MINQLEKETILPHTQKQQADLTVSNSWSSDTVLGMLMGGTLLNSISHRLIHVGQQVFLAKFSILSNLILISFFKVLSKLHSWNIKKSVFTLSVKLLSHGPLKAPPMFSPILNTSSPFLTVDGLPGSVVQTKSRITILWNAKHWPGCYLSVEFYYYK